MHLDPSVVRELPELLWLAVAPALAMGVVRLRRAELAWLVPVAALWTVWRCGYAVVVLPFELGGWAGYTLGPLAAAALLVHVVAAFRVAASGAEAAPRPRHALVLSGMVVLLVGVGAVAAATRFASVPRPDASSTAVPEAPRTGR